MIKMRNISHILGEHMKDQGTDRVSRGQLKEGVLTGKDMLSFIPLHLSAIQRLPPVETWLKSWLSKDAKVEKCSCRKAGSSEGMIC
jgi:hypothetical protein